MISKLVCKQSSSKSRIFLHDTPLNCYHNIHLGPASASAAVTALRLALISSPTGSIEIPPFLSVYFTLLP